MTSRNDKPHSAVSLLAMAELASSPNAVIDEDILCAGCRYNLRTQPQDALCPECGKPVAESVRLHVLHLSELGQLRANGVPWLRAMHGGVTIALVAWLVSLSGFFYSTRLGLPDSRDKPFAIFWLLPFVSVYVTSHFAAWRLMTPRGRLRTLRIARALVIAAVLSPGLLFINSRWAYAYQRWFIWPLTLPSEGFTHAVRSTAGVTMLACPLVGSATFGRLVQLAWVARRYVIAVLFGSVGLLYAGWLAFMSWIFASGHDLPSISSEFVPTLAGPSGTLPAIWMTVTFAFSELSDGIARRNPDVLFPLLIIAVIVLSSLGQGVMLWSLRRTLRRAIALETAAATRTFVGATLASSA